MKKHFILLILAVCLIVSIVSAVDIPKIVPYVNDFANLLSPDEEIKLNLLCDAIEKNSTYEIAIVTVTDTGGLDRIDFANKIGDENGVGKKDKDNGIVVLWSVEDGGAIATGRFAESILNDAKVVRIGKAARPLFDNQSYYLAFNQIVNDIAGEINSTGVPSEGSDDDGGNDNTLIFILIIGGVIFFIIFSGIMDSSGGSYSSGSGGVVSTVIRTAGGSKSSGGGVSFGGGGFGGGGGKF